MRRQLLYDRASPAATAAATLLRERFDVRPLEGSPPAETVVLVDASDTGVGYERVRTIGVVDSTAGPWPVAWYSVVPVGAGAAMLARAVDNAFDDLDAAASRARLERELSELNAIGIRLSSERDPAALLETILTKARGITSSDAGSLYLVEEEGREPPRLRFALTQNDSVDVPFTSVTLPLTPDSVAGYVALTGTIVNLEDAYATPPGSPFKINRWFDEHSGYRTRSMLVVPMRTPQGETIGALQLINCKGEYAGPLVGEAGVERHVRRFDARHEKLAGSLASQAAVAVHNSRLYESVHRLFEGFVKASVIAIESRDPTTFGHSFRVADLTVGLAEVVDRVDAGAYRTIRFGLEEMRELRYASLLHDFGKVGVREHVLVKSKKLYPVDLDRIRHRVELLKRDLELRAMRTKLDLVLDGGRAGLAAQAAHLDAELAAALAELDQHLGLVVLANEPTVLPDRDFTPDLMRLTTRAIITAEEAHVLAIPRGSLTELERLDIQAHVVHTFQFLAEIPWTRELKRVPEIARSHHEKLDGSGYPYGIRAEGIPLQSRMMAISDIYDALTSTDRPYKKAVRAEEALDILDAERRAGALDSALLDLFIEARVYERIIG
jgi:HD-GYP domain-containing protein (c-di-GMP phosphodiesterase class II)